VQGWRGERRYSTGRAKAGKDVERGRNDIIYFG